MTDDIAQTLSVIPQDRFRARAELLGMEVAGPSARGCWLVRDIDNSVWLFGDINSHPQYGRTMVASAWTDVNVSVMNHKFGVKSE